MGDKLINSSSKLEDEKKDKINLYLKTFVIAVGNITKSDKEIKKEAIIYIIKNINKHKIKLNVSEKMVKILEGKDFEPKDYDDILCIMTKGVFDEIHLLILKKKKQYIDCLKLLLFCFNILKASTFFVLSSLSSSKVSMISSFEKIKLIILKKVLVSKRINSLKTFSVNNQ